MNSPCRAHQTQNPMMALQKRWPIEFFRLTDGSEPVRTWLDDLPEEVRGKVLARVDLMAEHGPPIWTIRIHPKSRDHCGSCVCVSGRTRYRVLYFLDTNRTGLLLHGFTKNTSSVEEADKKIARARIEQHSQRLEKQKRKHDLERKG